MNDNPEQKPISALPGEQFISRLTVSKVTNLGNFENRKIEISINFSGKSDAGKVLTEIEQIIDDVNCTKDVDNYELRRARTYLLKPIEELTEWDKENLELYQKRVDDYDALVARRNAALEKLNQFGGATELRDAKTSWDDEDYD